MAKIPTYDTLQIAPQGLPGARQNIRGITPSAFGAGTGEAIQRGANMAAAIYKQKKAEDITTLVQEKMQEAERAHLEFYMTGKERLGKNAFGITDESKQFSAKLHQDLMKDMPTEARQAFDLRYSDLSNTTYKWAGGHEFQNRDLHQTTVFQSGVETKRQMAIANPDKDSVKSAFVGIAQYLDHEAKRKGYDDEWVQTQLQKEMDSVHASNLRNYYQSGEENVDSMRSYLEIWDKTISPEIKAQYQAAVGKIDLGNKAKAYAGQLVEDGITLADALEKTQTEYGDTNDSDVYISAVAKAFRIQDQIKNENYTEAKDTIKLKVVETEGDWIGLDPDLVATASPDFQLTVFNAQRQQRENLRDNSSIFARYDHYDMVDYVEDLIGGGEISEPNGLNQYAVYMTRPTYEQLRERVKTNSKVDISKAKASFMAHNGFKKDEWTEDRRRSWDAFRTSLDKEIDEAGVIKDYDDLAYQWTRQTKDTFSWVPGYDPDTVGEAVLSGNPYYLDADEYGEDKVKRIINMSGIDNEFSGDADKFYTEYVAEAPRRISNIGMPVTPETIAAYAVLKEEGKKVTKRNLFAVQQKIVEGLSDE